MYRGGGGLQKFLIEISHVSHGQGRVDIYVHALMSGVPHGDVATPSIPLFPEVPGNELITSVFNGNL